MCGCKFASITSARFMRPRLSWNNNSVKSSQDVIFLDTNLLFSDNSACIYFQSLQRHFGLSPKSFKTCRLKTSYAWTTLKNHTNPTTMRFQAYTILMRYLVISPSPRLVHMSTLRPLEIVARESKRKCYWITMFYSLFSPLTTSSCSRDCSRRRWWSPQPSWLACWRPASSLHTLT